MSVVLNISLNFSFNFFYFGKKTFVNNKIFDKQKFKGRQWQFSFPSATEPLQT